MSRVTSAQAGGHDTDHLRDVQIHGHGHGFVYESIELSVLRNAHLPQYIQNLGNDVSIKNKDPHLII